MDVESVRDGSLAGMAEFLRGQYRVADNLYVICRLPGTDVVDVSRPRTAEDVQNAQLQAVRVKKRAERENRERLRVQRERRWELRRVESERLKPV